MAGWAAGGDFSFVSPVVKYVLFFFNMLFWVSAGGAGHPPPKSPGTHRYPPTRGSHRGPPGLSRSLDPTGTPPQPRGSQQGPQHPRIAHPPHPRGVFGTPPGRPLIAAGVGCGVPHPWRLLGVPPPVVAPSSPQTCCFPRPQAHPLGCHSPLGVSSRPQRQGHGGGDHPPRCHRHQNAGLWARSWPRAGDSPPTPTPSGDWGRGCGRTPPSCPQPTPRDTACVGATPLSAFWGLLLFFFCC